MSHHRPKPQSNKDMTLIKGTSVAGAIIETPLFPSTGIIVFIAIIHTPTGATPIIKLGATSLRGKL